MFLYVEEVKYAPPRPYHWLCALAFPIYRRDKCLHPPTAPNISNMNLT